ncbi:MULTISPECIES: glutathione S-transferase family protein [Sodalis]|uniref:Glutathione S-transferase n=1 Tax=Sodalis ligni TaxID=2697027 RepID=A0A4R1NGR9_9GAMM|nr:glutathione S-transferase [Sodalis ligni]TCL06169.1 glutathione S-transferase [Sodalis ligni]
MKIYDTPGFPNPLRVRIVLGEKDLLSQVEFIKIDLIAAEHKQPAFLAINPTGTVPVLELDDGTYISECTAITEYLDNLTGNPTLTGRTAREKAVIHMMQKRAESELIDAIGIYFHHATPGLGPILQAHKHPEWEGRTQWGRMHREQAEGGLHYFDRVLREQPFIAGEAFSMADATVLGGLLFAHYADIPVSAEYSALLAWKERMYQRPSVANA